MGETGRLRRGSRRKELVEEVLWVTAGAWLDSSMAPVMGSVWVGAIGSLGDEANP